MPKKKAEVETQEESFVVINTERTKVSVEKEEPSADEIAQRALERAVREYNWDNKLSSVILDDRGSVTNPTSDYLSALADYPQESIEKTKQIIRIISRMVNIDDIIGKTVEAIRTNINTQYRLSYAAEEGRNKSKKLRDAKKFIDDFNETIKLKRIIRDDVPRAYQEGNVIMFLRNDENDYVVDVYPVGLAILAPYTIGGEPVVLIDINELKSRLQRAGFKNRNGKNMFFPSVEDEIKNNYPESVYLAYKNKEPYAQLDVRYSGVVRIGNCGKTYGLSPIFRALSSSLLLQAYYRSDELNSKARAKKILFQNLKPGSKENGKISQKEMALSHKELLLAYQQSGSVVYTATPWVENLKFVESSGDLIDVKNISFHQNRELATLGIAFLSSESANQSVSTATISLEQLMKTINSITEQFEEVFHKWYECILQDNGFDPSFAPSIKILDSEALEFKLRKELATFFYSILNLSMRTTLETLGYDLTEEVTRRIEENEQNLQDVFFPRVSQFNVSKDTPVNGRPPSDEKTDKNQYDEEYNKVREGAS